MKRKVLFALIAVLAISVLTVANVITVGFVGKNADDNRYVQLDSVAIENLTKNWRQVAIYPDTIVELQLTEQTAVPEVTMPRFGISDLAPNPAEGVAYFNLSVTKSGKVVLTITDLNGRSLLNLSDEMQTGVFAYRVTMETATTYVLRATNGAETSVAKIINRKPAGETSLTQIAEINSARVMQKIAQLPENKLDSTDLMQYTGFVTVGDSLYTSEQVEQKQIEDETIELIFHLCETIETEFSVTECEKFVWNEIELTESGDFYQTFTAVNGCDSVVTLHLTINQPAETILTEILCFGETYTENGFDASESGTFTQELKTVNGCDSIVTLNLTVLPKIETEFSVTECDSYTWNDQTYTESGDYQQVLQTAIGCDSTVTLHLTINNTLETTFDVTICFGETYTENGFDASESGIFTQKLKAAKGCDSIVTLNLTVLPKIETEFSDTTLVNPYTWDGTTYEVSGDYTKTYTAANGCDSTVTFHYRRGFIDERDGTFYKVVKIGDQIWMAENLRYLPQIDGQSSLLEPKYRVYGYTGYNVVSAKTTENYKTYGVLYNWLAAMESALASWKLPTQEEWDILINAVGTNGAAKLAGCADLWNDGILKNSTDFGTSGFDGLPAGYYWTDVFSPGFQSIKTFAGWWTATTSSISTNQSYRKIIRHNSVQITEGSSANSVFGSVRYLFVPLTVGTTEVSEITPTTATVSSTIVSSGAGVTEKGFVYSATENPEIGGEGVTKVMAEGEDFTATIPASCGTTYYVRAYATNTEEGTVYSEQKEIYFAAYTELFVTTLVNSYTWDGTTYEVSGDYTKTYTTANGCDSIVTFHYRRGFVDERDGNFYKVVKIGDQIWMAENLRYLPQVYKASVSTDPRYYVYAYTGSDVAAAKATENYQTYGALYNWYAAMESAPAGWKLPTTAEWDVLKNAVGDNAGAKLAGRADLWLDGTLKNSTDLGTSGFEGLPAGYMITNNANNSAFASIKTYAYWWTATATSGTKSYAEYINNSSLGLGQNEISNYNGYSVRCLFVPLAIGTTEVSEITPTTATVSGTFVSTGAGVTEKGFVYSTSENPEIDGEGVTKVMAESEDFTATIPASCGTIYYVRAYATNTEEGTVYGEQSEVHFGIHTEFSDTSCVNPYTWEGTTYENSGDYTKTYTAANGCDSIVTLHYTRGFTDERDGNFYKVVKIGDQLWMAENLRYLPKVSIKPLISFTDPYYYVYGYNGYTVAAAKVTENYQTYGVLYNWSAAMESAPVGWKLPTQEEWDVLKTVVGETNAGAKLAGRADLWIDGNLKNSADFGTSGFEGLPAGYYYSSGNTSDFSSIKNATRWWTATNGNSSYEAYYRSISNNSVALNQAAYNKDYAFSVRYIFAPLAVGSVEASITPTTATVSSTIVSSGLGVTEKGFVYSATENPEIGNEGVTKVMAEGEDFTVTIPASCGTIYYVRAYATNTEEGTVYSEQSEVYFGIYTEFSDTTFNPYTWDGTTYEASGDYTKTFTAINGCDSIVTLHYTRGFTDERDGNFYKVVKIGDQLWMAENLRYLPQVDKTSSSTGPRYYVYGYSGTDVAAAKATENYQIYGVLYNWYAANEVAPAGWKLPSREEWNDLRTAVGTNAGAKLAGRADLWQDGTLKQSTDFGTFGFEGLPAGHYTSQFNKIGQYAYWWSTTHSNSSSSSSSSFHQYLDYNSVALNQVTNSNSFGYSVRCLYVGTTE